jgi:FkbM family methyltransferase
MAIWAASFERLAGLIYRKLLSGPKVRQWVHTVILRLIPRSIRVGPARLFLDPSDPVISGALTLGVYERQEMAFFNRFIGQARTFVDVGANVGLYTALALRQMSARSTVVAVEPHPRAYQLLQRNIEANLASNAHSPQVVLAFNIAAGSSEGTATLHCNRDNGGDHRLAAPGPEHRQGAWSTQPVPVQRLDHLLPQHGLSEVDFIKMDVQGHEAEVVKGLADTLSRSARVVLMSEFWPAGLASSGGAARYLALLDELGMEVFQLRPSRKGWLEPVSDPMALVESLAGDRYTTLVALKGFKPSDFDGQPGRQV